jgi:putative Mg2+ transporter-C (MgtC) family protein
MPLSLGWPDIALRLALTLIAGALIGMDRDEHGRPAGMRTTILVCLAASLAMIMVNLELGTRGRASDSFVMLDLMRLPLGILTGVGFIGAGAILRGPDGVIGVTTAATVWFVTVIGLCFGSGEIALGLVGTAIALIVLSLLGRVERFIPRIHHAILTATISSPALEAELDRVLAEARVRIARRSIACTAAPAQMRLELVVRWRSSGGTPRLPGFLAEFGRHEGVELLQWQSQS